MSAAQKEALLEEELNGLRRFVLKEQARTDKILAAVETGEVCKSLGHRYHLPDQLIRDKIVKLGWQIERRCMRCGEVDGAWSEEHWTVPGMTAIFSPPPGSRRFISR